MAPPSARAQGTPHRILNELQAVHGHSVPGPIVSTPGGGTFNLSDALAIIFPP